MNNKYEKGLFEQGIKYIGGIDEVGRGPLYGPVVAACVILKKEYQLEGLTDSKRLNEKQRERYYQDIQSQSLAIGIGIIDPEEIDKINILEASKKAMINAVNNCKIKPEHLLIDAVKIDIEIPQTNIIKGDLKSISIAAASVIAKVTRDNMLKEVDKKHPQYGFKNHKGYPTKQHIENIKKYGLISGYRKTYQPIKSLLDK